MSSGSAGQFRRPAAPRGRAWRAGTPLLSAPWRRAPWLPWRQPAVILAVTGAAAIMGCAAASAPLFLSSAGSASLQLQLAAQCPDAAYPVLQQIGFAVGPSRPEGLSEEVPAAMAAQGLPAPSGSWR